MGLIQILKARVPSKLPTLDAGGATNCDILLFQCMEITCEQSPVLELIVAEQFGLFCHSL